MPWATGSGIVLKLLVPRRIRLTGWSPLQVLEVFLGWFGSHLLERLTGICINLEKDLIVFIHVEGWQLTRPKDLVRALASVMCIDRLC